jgi:hypothetical protein
MSDELMPGKREPDAQQRQAAPVPSLGLLFSLLAFTLKLVAVQHPHPSSVLFLSNQVL